MPEEGSAKQNLGDPPAIIVQVIIGPARQKWDIPRSNPGDIYLYYILKDIKSALWDNSILLYKKIFC